MKGIRYAAFAGLLAAAPGLAFAQNNGQWTGFYAGAQAGINSSSANSGISTEQALNLGILGGYTFQVANHVVVGGNAFYEWNQGKTHSGPGGTAKIGTNVYGVDAMVGFPLSQSGAWMPFVKIGYGWANFTDDASSTPSQNAMRYGAGIEWRTSEMLGFTAQYMYQKFGSDVADWQNQNFTVGVNFHF